MRGEREGEETDMVKDRRRDEERGAGRGEERAGEEERRRGGGVWMWSLMVCGL